MINISTGRYWDLPWSLVSGCTPCSPGCDHCWSAAMAHRFCREGEPGHCVGILTDKKGRFNGDIITHPERLSIPLKRRKPTVYAIWNDWAHEDVDNIFRHKMVIEAEFSEQHTFLALTKRPKVVLDFWQSGVQHVPANWWNGLTVCNQQEADAKIPVFLQVPGKKFLSIEPMLGPVNIAKWMHPDSDETANMCYEKGFDAVILGGETGPGARPMHPDWVRSVRDQCETAGVPFFFKQWGEYVPIDIGSMLRNFFDDKTGGRKHLTLVDKQWVDRVGHAKSGRLLDGRTHDDLPWNQRVRPDHTCDRQEFDESKRNFGWKS